MDYRYERGKVGTWNGKEVWIMDAVDYDPYVNCISVIADDGMKMVQNGYVVGFLKANGNVSQLAAGQHYAYKHKVKLPVVEEPKPLPQKEEVELPDTAIPAGYFEQFSNIVDEFFSTLGKEN